MFKRKVSFTIMVAVLIVVSIVCFSGCQEKKHGPIPYGSYALYENGEIKQTPAEYNWNVYSKIEFLYSTYVFAEDDDGKTYFEMVKDGVAIKFQFKYNDTTGVLSVYLPEDIYTNYQNAIEGNSNYVWMDYLKK